MKFNQSVQGDVLTTSVVSGGCMDFKMSGFKPNIVGIDQYFPSKMINVLNKHSLCEVCVSGQILVVAVWILIFQGVASGSAALF